LKQLAEILEKMGVQKETIEQIHNEMVVSKEFDLL
jgi:hypothetical protein